MTVQLIQVYYDQTQAKAILKPADSVMVYPILNTKLYPSFENDLISRYVPNLLGDYIGLLSWKAGAKLGPLVPSTFPAFCEGVDVLSFFLRIARQSPKSNPIKQGNNYHVQSFSEIFGKVMELAGLPQPPQAFQAGSVIMQNAVIAKRAVYLDYIETYLKPFLGALEHPDIKDLTWQSSKYAYVPQPVRIRCLKAWGFNNYPLHPFLCERLWSVYVLHKGLTVRHYGDQRIYQFARQDTHAGTRV